MQEKSNIVKPYFTEPVQHVEKPYVFKRADIFLKPFAKNALGYTSLTNVIAGFETKPLDELRSDIETIIAYTLKMMNIYALDKAHEVAQGLTDQELVKYIAIVNPMFKSKHSWGLKQGDIKKRLKTYEPAKRKYNRRCKTNNKRVKIA